MATDSKQVFSIHIEGLGRAWKAWFPCLLPLLFSALYLCLSDFSPMEATLKLLKEEWQLLPLATCQPQPHQLYLNPWLQKEKVGKKGKRERKRGRQHADGRKSTWKFLCRRYWFYTNRANTHFRGDLGLSQSWLIIFEQGDRSRACTLTRLRQNNGDYVSSFMFITFLL